MRRAHRLVPGIVLPVLAIALLLAPSSGQTAAAVPGINHINNVIVIYQENRSFDATFGFFPGADGLNNAVNAPPQTHRDGSLYVTLPQPLNNNAPDLRFPPDLPPRPYNLAQYVPPNQNTGDMIHAFYREQYQINNGRLDRFISGSDNKGLVLGYYDLSGSSGGAPSPLYQLAQQYTLVDRFFHAAFGGSFLNHFWLVCACTPLFPNAPASLISTPFPANAADQELVGLQQDTSVTPDGFAVNTTQPSPPPYRSGTPANARLPLQMLPHIGDRLDAAGVSWAWFAGGWNDAVAGNPGPLFQYHHQPFNYFANVGGDPAKRPLHLKDEFDFLAALQNGTLPQVSFVKPYGALNEHPGYTDLISGDQHAADLVRAVQNSPYWPTSAIIITYDENGGQWDHVAPPAPPDRWGPGTRVPTIIISPFAKRGFVDHTTYDTTAILSFIEARWNLLPLGTRDAAQVPLTNAFAFPGAAPTPAPTATIQPSNGVRLPLLRALPLLPIPPLMPLLAPFPPPLPPLPILGGAPLGSPSVPLPRPLTLDNNVTPPGVMPGMVPPAPAPEAAPTATVAPAAPTPTAPPTLTVPPASAPAPVTSARNDAGTVSEPGADPAQPLLPVESPAGS